MFDRVLNTPLKRVEQSLISYIPAKSFIFDVMIPDPEIILSKELDRRLYLTSSEQFFIFLLEHKDALWTRLRLYL